MAAKKGKTKSVVLSTKIQKKQMLEALEKTLGVVSTALATIPTVSKAKYYRWLNSDEKFRTEVVELQNVALDFVESKLHKLINEDNPAAVFFYLKCKGKARGYIERGELDVRADVAIKIVPFKNNNLEDGDKSK